MVFRPFPRIPLAEAMCKVKAVAIMDKAESFSNNDYANRILGLIFSLGGVAVSRAVLPVLSSLQGNTDEMKALTVRWAWGVGALGTGLALFVWLFAPWLVQILFEHGAFDSTASDIVSSILRYGLPQLP